MIDIWIVSSKILFPVATISHDINGNILNSLEYYSRYIPNVITEIDSVKLFIEKYEDTSEEKYVNIKGEFYEYVSLVCQMPCSRRDDIVHKSTPYIEWACDQMAFFVQKPIIIYSCEISSLSDKNNKQLFTHPLQSAKFRSSIFHNTIIPKDIPLIKRPKNFSEKDLAVLRWYHKSLAASYDIDKFLFLWVCLEILRKIKGIAVKEPYLAPCNHEIHECPICHKSTEKTVNGKTLQLYLINELNVPKEVAKKMWRFRQMLHGEIPLTDETTSHMGDLIMKLQAAVNLGLKRRFGISDSNPPIVKPEGVMMSAMSIQFKVNNPIEQ
jgi:hypothetical protein